MSNFDNFKNLFKKPPEEDLVLKAEKIAKAKLTEDEKESLEEAVNYCSTNNIQATPNMSPAHGTLTTNGTLTTTGGTIFNDLTTNNSMTIEADTIGIGCPQFNDKTKINSKVTILGKVSINSENKVPNKFMRWVYKKFFYAVWEDISCDKCTSRLACLVNKSFESNCKIK